MLERLNPERHGEKSKNVPNSLTTFQQKAKTSLPKELIEILTYFEGAVWFNNEVIFKPDEPSPMDDETGFQSIDFLFGPGSGDYSLEYYYKMYSHQLQEGLVPIGSAPGGNLICIASDGSICYWYHEGSESECVYRIAPSFVDFLNRLEIEENQPTGIKVIEEESWLDF